MKQFVTSVIVVALVFCVPAMAKDLGAITGQVLMADGKTPAVNHYVTAFDLKTGRPLAKAKTDATGAYEIASVPVGRYRVAAAENVSAVVAVPKLPQVVEVNLVLHPVVRGQGVRRGGTSKTPIVVGVVGGVVAGGIIGGVVGYNSNDDDDTKYVVQQVASPSMP